MKELKEIRIAYPYETTVVLRTARKPSVQCLKLFVGGGGSLQYYTIITVVAPIAYRNNEGNEHQKRNVLLCTHARSTTIFCTNNRGAQQSVLTSRWTVDTRYDTLIPTSSPGCL